MDCSPDARGSARFPLLRSCNRGALLLTVPPPLATFGARHPVGLSCTDAVCVGLRMYVQIAHKMFVTLALGAQVAGQGVAAPGRLDLADFSEVARDSKHQPGSK
jgi:hypothetical protein